MEFQLLNAKLANMSANIALTEEGIWRLFCIYQEQSYDMHIEYPSDFSIRDTSNELDTLEKASQLTDNVSIGLAIDLRVAELLGVEDYEPGTPAGMDNNAE